MSKSIGLLIVHGMGDTRPDFYKELTEPLRKRLKADWGRIAWRSVFYQSELQGNEDAIFRKMRPQIRWRGLRELMLYGFSDAGSLEHKKELLDSPYYRTQKLILDRLDELHDELGDASAPIAIVAHSLGGHVLSNYIWDAQQPVAFAGVWNGALRDGVPAGSPRDQFRRLRTLQRFLTTGCNIPVFVAGHNTIEPIDGARLGAGFRWINHFDPDDVLGWPLQQLSSAYEMLVEDVRVNAGGDSWLGKFRAFTPYSHMQYWSTNKVLDRIAEEIRRLLP
ncbi:MAG: hypothetical protein ACREV5_11380 [Steroidobacter sp.]